MGDKDHQRILYVFRKNVIVNQIMCLCLLIHASQVSIQFVLIKKNIAKIFKL